MKNIIVSAALITSATAAVVNESYSNPGTDGVAFAYRAHITFDQFDSWSSSTSVGGWSHADLATTANPNRGWGHAAGWYLIEIEEESNFILSLTGANSTARPGFVIFAGESIEDDPSQAHTYSNNGLDMFLNDRWDDNGAPKAGGAPVDQPWNTNDPALTYVGSGINLSSNSLSNSVTLAPGRYTLAIGNAADSATANVSETYSFTFTTVPEPSSTLLIALGGLALMRRRR